MAYLQDLLRSIGRVAAPKERVRPEVVQARMSFRAERRRRRHMVAASRRANRR